MTGLADLISEFIIGILSLVFDSILAGLFPGIGN